MLASKGTLVGVLDTQLLEEILMSVAKGVFKVSKDEENRSFVVCLEYLEDEESLWNKKVKKSLFLAKCVTICNIL